jgi:hypothetical protein
VGKVVERLFRWNRRQSCHEQSRVVVSSPDPINRELEVVGKSELAKGNGISNEGDVSERDKPIGNVSGNTSVDTFTASAPSFCVISHFLCTSPVGWCNYTKWCLASRIMI